MLADVRAARAETDAVRTEAREAARDELLEEVRAARRETEAARRETEAVREEARVVAVRAEERHQEVMQELREIKCELGEIKEMLAWKSRTSARNPARLNLTHMFAILAGRKQRVPDADYLDVPLEGRDPITTEREPTLRDDEFIRVRVISGQQKYVSGRIAKYSEIGESVQRTGYMAGGIDFRQNVKASGKRKHKEVADLTGDVRIPIKKQIVSYPS